MYSDLSFCGISCNFNDNILLRILSLVTKQRWCVRGREREKQRRRGFSSCKHHQLLQGLQTQQAAGLEPPPPCRLDKESSYSWSCKDLSAAIN